MLLAVNLYRIVLRQTLNIGDGRIISEYHVMKQLQNEIEHKEFSDEAKKKLGNCPLRVQELEQSGHLLIEVSGAAWISFN